MTEIEIGNDISEKQFLNHSFPREITEFGIIMYFSGMKFSKHQSGKTLTSSGSSNVSIN
jgi:hypothetical protein